jgi:hypothetical protein
VAEAARAARGDEPPPASRPGRRRLWLTFLDEKIKLAERAIYITFE